MSRTAPAIREPAPAKVNLFLHVGRKRADGYHDLTSLVVFPDVGDTISVTSEKRPLPRIREGANSGPPTRGGQDAVRDDGEGIRAKLKIIGPYAKNLLVDKSNLVLRAADALAAGRGAPGAKVVLTKNLPIASGIGGGSADAAATLRALNDAWRLRLTKNELREIGLTLGSDVPVCIDKKPQWMEGRGERVERGPRMPEFYLTLVNPGVAVPTAAVFRALTAKSGAKRPLAPKSFSSARSLSAWLAAETRNDLQPPAMGIAAPIADVLARLETQTGCLLARMSGSGATCFGVFETMREAERAAAAMPVAWWAKAASCR